jgi:hypothetical protein
MARYLEEGWKQEEKYKAYSDSRETTPLFLSQFVSK